MGLFDRLFRREDLVSESHESEQHAASAHQHGRKGLELAAQTLGLLHLRDVEPQPTRSGSYYPRVEGDLLVDGEPVTLTLIASTSSHPNRGGLSSDSEYRSVRVVVLSGLQTLGNISYDWSSSFEDASEEKYQLSNSGYNPEIPETDFLTGIQQAARQERELVRATPAAVPYPGTPSLSSIDETSVDSGSTPVAPSPSRGL